MSTDSELLRQYAEKSDEAAFAEVVRRQVDFVYSAALRVVNGDVHLAQDVTQGVFVQLARHAGMLAGRETVLGWLHTTARNTAIKAIRGEQRRHAREQEATLMNESTTTAEINWNDLRPVLDEAVHKLGERDRNAVLLRFFKGLSHQEVGAVLGVSEDTARKRVERALEKLRLHFARRGVTVSSALLATAISVNSVQAAPVDLAARVTGPSLAGVGGAGTTSILWRALYMSTKTKIILAVAILAIIGTTLTISLQHPDHPNSAVLPVQLPAPKPPAVSASVTESSPAILAGIEAPTVVAIQPNLKTTASAPSAKSANAGGVGLNKGARQSLDTAIPEAIRLLEAQDRLGFFREFLAHEQQQSSKMTMEQLDETIRESPRLQQQMDQLTKDLQTIQGQTPVLDASGDEATFTIPKNPNEVGHTEFIFHKIEGLWYIDAHSIDMSD